jgi:hypothetical protein
MDAWGGIVWQDPPDDWGNLPGGYDLTGAKRLSFWARESRGGEIVSFELGLYGKDKPFPDSSNSRKPEVRLTTEWQQFSLDLSGRDLSCIKSGFAVVVQGQGRPLTIFLDAVRFE